MNTHKDNHKRIIFSIFAIFFSSQSSFVFSEEKDSPFQVEIAKVVQNMAPIQTISLEYEVEKRENEKEPFKKDGKYRLVFDKGRNMFHIKCYAPQNEMARKTTERFFKDGVLTSIYSWEGSRFVDINYQSKWDFQDTNTLFFFDYDEVVVDGPLIKNGKIDYLVAVSKVQRNGKTFLLIGDETLSDAKKDLAPILIFSFLFDIKTGLLAETNMTDVDIEGDKLVHKKTSKRVISDYAHSNGFSFPADMTYISFPSGHTLRTKVNKKTIRIGEPIDDKEFDAVLPPGSEVTDHIKGTFYITPSIGNTGAEEKIVKELDELFQKTNQ